MGDIRLREDTLKAKCTYKYILTGINKEVRENLPQTITDVCFIHIHVIRLVPNLSACRCTMIFVHRIAGPSWKRLGFDKR
jgi:hypothetical protein